MKYKIYECETKQFVGKKLIAIAGIGNPDNFYKSLSNLNMNIVKKFTFPDHYQFSEEDLDFGDSLPVIMTEKDAVRCLEMKNKNLWYLSIEAKFEDENLADEILTKLSKINE